MRRTLHRALFSSVAAIMLLLVGGAWLMAQDQMPDPAQIREMRLERIKTMSGVADADWEAVKPKVEAVMEKQLPMMMGGMRGMRGGQGGGGGQGAGAGRMAGMFGPQMEEMTALRETLSNESASNDEVKAKLDAFIAAYKKRQAEFKDAQKALASAVGDKIKLKAVLIMNGMLPIE